MGLKTISPVSLPSVVGCGFLMEDAVEGDKCVRIANAETDASIQCLHDISKSNK